MARERANETDARRFLSERALSRCLEDRRWEYSSWACPIASLFASENRMATYGGKMKKMRLDSENIFFPPSSIYNVDHRVTIELIIRTSHCVELGILYTVKHKISSDPISRPQDTNIRFEGSHRMTFYLTPLVEPTMYIEDIFYFSAIKSVTVRSRRHGNARNVVLTREALVKLFGHSRTEAAKKLGIGLTRFKSACRELGLKEWPFQKWTSVVNVDTLQRADLSTRMGSNLFQAQDDAFSVHEASEAAGLSCVDIGAEQEDEHPTSRATRGMFPNSEYPHSDGCALLEVCEDCEECKQGRDCVESIDEWLASNMPGLPSDIVGTYGLPYSREYSFIE